MRSLSTYSKRSKIKSRRKAAVEGNVVLNSRISLTVSEPRAFQESAVAAKCAHLLAALLAISASVAQAQAGSTQRVNAQPPGPGLVSINQLQTPEKAQRTIERARDAFAQGRYDAALSDAERALDLYPRCATALNIEGAVNLSRTNFDKAGQDFQRAIDADPALGQAYLGLGMAHASQGRFREALVPLDRAAAFLPSSWMVYFEAALAHLGTDEPEAALTEITYAERFIGSDPKKRSRTAYLRGIAHSKMRDYSDAKRDLNEAVASDPNGISATHAGKKLEQLLYKDDGQQVARSTVGSPF
jgi:tetratricopeptide (TPR) repeat protein